MQLATVGEDGAPKIRTIVLRSFNEASASLSFITDLRSPKVREITANPCVSLAGFDNERVVQLRIDGRAEIVAEANPAASTGWRAYGGDPGGTRYSAASEITRVEAAPTPCRKRTTSSVVKSGANAPANAPAT